MPSKRQRLFFLNIMVTFCFSLLMCSGKDKKAPVKVGNLEMEFQNPPNSARPGVYWYFMDGNISREGITADLESMAKAGIGNVLFLEVNVGVPRGPIDFMSDTWQDLFSHAVHEAERLGIELFMGTGPGWCGSGGPWVTPELSMQHLVASATNVKGPGTFHALLPVPDPMPPTPYMALSPGLKQQRQDYFRDVAVLAFPTPTDDARIKDIVEKALYDRAPYTSAKGVKPYLLMPADYPSLSSGQAILRDKIVDLTAALQADGTLNWQIPSGQWTILRFVSRNSGATTRPAPDPGFGFECDKFDTAAFYSHFENYAAKLLDKIGPRKKDVGWTMLHIDSWEMGAQNWTPKFRDEFRRRRGYDPQPFFPAYAGYIVESPEITERFLWDVRQTGQELVLDYHAGYVKTLGRRYGFGLSIEPYDMNPCSDLALGAVADVPMCEFWSEGLGFDAAFSCIEAASIAHTMGRPIVGAEAFTALPEEAWRQHPGSMKNQGDWAFCIGVNRFVYHTYAHQPLGDEHLPGMTMGPYGVHWDRRQTWWPMAAEYHRYVSRCSHMLRQGSTVSDILYLTPEGAPHVFRAPASALDRSSTLTHAEEYWLDNGRLEQQKGSGTLVDKKGHGFDGCSPNILMERAKTVDGTIQFSEGSSYRLLVLPDVATMTPELLRKITDLVKEGATLLGNPPKKSPSLVNYPQCDQDLNALVKELWGGEQVPAQLAERPFGKGKVFWGAPCTTTDPSLYPDYGVTADILQQMGVKEDFTATGPVRYGHRHTNEREIYFVANKTSDRIQVECTFRVDQGQPQLWNPVNGERRNIAQFSRHDGMTTIPMPFDSFQSYFVVFNALGKGEAAKMSGPNFPEKTPLLTLAGAWHLSFDTTMGGPQTIMFDTLVDWTKRDERGIKYYSGIAVYEKTFDLPDGVDVNRDIYLDLGVVKNLARVLLNGKEVGTVWTAPWQVKISGVVKARDNHLEISVANLWPNRLIGDQQAPDANVRTVRWDSGLLAGKEYKTGRYTFTTYNGGKLGTVLLPSGLLGPVVLLQEN